MHARYVMRNIFLYIVVHAFICTPQLRLTCHFMFSCGIIIIVYLPPAVRLILLTVDRYELPQPSGGRMNDVSAWNECVDNSRAQLEHQVLSSRLMITNQYVTAVHDTIPHVPSIYSETYEY